MLLDIYLNLLLFLDSFNINGHLFCCHCLLCPIRLLLLHLIVIFLSDQKTGLRWTWWRHLIISCSSSIVCPLCRGRFAQHVKYGGCWHHAALVWIKILLWSSTSPFLKIWIHFIQITFKFLWSLLGLLPVPSLNKFLVALMHMRCRVSTKSGGM